MQNHNHVIAPVEELDRIKAIVDELLVDSLQHLALHYVTSLVGTADRVLASLAPDNVLVQEAHDSVDVAAVESFISGAEASDRRFERLPAGSLARRQSPSVGTGFSPE